MIEEALRASLYGAGVVAFAVWLFAVVKLREFWSHRWPRLPQLHHSWYGLAVYLWSLWAQPTSLWILGIAYLLLFDDAFQHTWQWFVNLSYRSPLWHLGRIAFYEPWYRLKAWMYEGVA